MSARLGMAAVILSLAAAAGWAQQPGGRTPPSGDTGMQQQGEPGMGQPGGQRRPPGGMGPGGAMADEFFPPELIMRHQQAIGLTDDQQAAIRAAMQKTMSSFNDLQWKRSAEEESLTTLVKQQPVDEKKALESFDRLTGIENEVKHAQFAMLIEVKNTLTADQQTKLRQMQQQDRATMGRNPANAGRGPDSGMGQPPSNRTGGDNRQGNDRGPGGNGSNRQGPPPGGNMPPPEE